MIAFDVKEQLRALERIDPLVSIGEVTELVGLVIESIGPTVAIGDFCEVRTSSGRSIRTQTIGFRNGRVLSMPLEETDGLRLGDAVIARPGEATVPVGPQVAWPRDRWLRQCA